MMADTGISMQACHGSNQAGEEMGGQLH